MKLNQIFCFFILLAVMFTSCKKEDEGNPIPDIDPDHVVEMPGPNPYIDNAIVLREGMFEDGAHPTTGTVEIYEQSNNYSLSINDFKTDNGPDLYVYLSKDKEASEFVDLGKLKAVSGTLSYDINPTVDIDAFPWVLIWCKEFSVLFGSAKTMMP